MQKELEDLWFNYLIENPIERSIEEKHIINSLSEKNKLFRSKLNDEQLKILNEYDDAVSQVGRISEKNAFIKGASHRDLIGFNPILSVNTSRKSLARRQPCKVLSFCLNENYMD